MSFRDSRPPQEVQHALEREFMVLLEPRLVDGALELRGTAAVNGAACRVVLRFLAALPDTNAYGLDLTLSWAGLPAAHHDYHRKTAESWFDLWTQPFSAAPAPVPGEGSVARASELAEPVLWAAAHPDSQETVQRRILEAVRAGGSFFTAHKEGGTVISWRGSRFVRQDYGESDAREEFPDDAAFLAFLRRFYEWETQRSIPGGAPGELERWRLIARLLRED